MFRIDFAVACAVLAAAAVSNLAAAQGRIACGEGMVQSPPRLVHRAVLEADRVPIRFVGHATFVLRSPQAVTVITDYNDYYRADVLPDVATMNANRGNHRTFRIEPSVAHALYGFDRGDGIPRHDVIVKDVRVYSEPTNIRPTGKGYTNDTAIFVIQVAGMCFAHLGHTAHVLDEETVRKLGRIDVAFTPVDRVVTQSYEELFHNIKALGARFVIPMHDIGWTTEQFLSVAQARFPVKRGFGDSVEVSRATLPATPEIWVLRPGGRSY